MHIRPLSPALRKKAAEEFNETQSKAISDISLLRDWLKVQPHLHSVNPKDQWLLAFLRGCKYNIEKCKGKIDMYYTLKVTVPEFYANRDPFDEKIQEILKLGVFLPLKKCMSEDSPRICISRVGFYSACSSDLSFADLIKVSLMIVEIMMLEDDNFTIAGEDVIADMSGIKFRLLWQWTPGFVRKVTACAQKALSVRLKSLYLLNPPFGLGAAITLFKTFIGAKIKDRDVIADLNGIRFGLVWQWTSSLAKKLTSCSQKPLSIFSHTKDTLHDQIDKSVLPEEYGGSDGTVHELIYYWKVKVESYREWFMDENAFSDESKRPETKNSGGFFQW